MKSSVILAFDWIQDALVSTIGGLLYRLLGSIFCGLLDWVQAIFRSLAGLSPIMIDGTTVNTGEEKYDIVYWLLQTDIVQDVFWSMVTFSLILMFLMTGLSIIRNAYQDKPKPIGSIIGGVFKGLLGMILLPIACMVGLMFGNIILLAVDSGTGAGGSQKLSGTLFLSAAYDANICRDGNANEEKDVERRASNFRELIDHTDFEDYLREVGLGEYAVLTENSLKIIPADDWEKLADAIDTAFASGQIKYNGGDTLDAYDTWKVETCYNLFDVNYVVFVVGGVLMLGFIFKMCFGLIGRIFKLTIDFVLIPVVMAMMPFDTKPSQTWKSDFVKNTVLAYSTVGVMNLYFSILPIVNKIEFSSDSVWGAGLFSPVLKLIITIVGLFSAESIISSVSGWFGTGDLLSEGKNVYGTFKGGMEKVTKQTKNVGGKVTGLFAGGVAGVKQANKVHGNRVAGFLTGAYGGSGLKSVVDKQMPKGFGDATKAGKEAYEKSRQFGWTKERAERHAASYAAQQSASKEMEAIRKQGLTGEEATEYIVNSNIGKMINAGDSATRASIGIQQQEKAGKDMTTYSKAQDNLTAMESNLTSMGLSSADISSYLDNGTITSGVSATLSTHPELLDLLKDAAEQNKAAKDSVLGALKGYANEQGISHYRLGGTTVYTVEQLERAVASGAVSARDLKNSISTGILEGSHNGTTWTNITLSNIQTEGRAASQSAKSQMADHRRYIEIAAKYIVNHADPAFTNLGATEQALVLRYVEEAKLEEEKH